jgi:hypothetical protein
MTTLFTILFIAGSVIMALRIYFGMLDVDLMPFACPKCYHGNESGIGFGPSTPWYSRDRNGIVYCRWCSSVFREHPNGSLVEDKPIDQ